MSPWPRKWLALVVVTLASVFAIGAAVAVPWLLTAEILDKDVTAQIRRTTGFATKIDGDTRFRLFPRPRVEIDHVVFFDPSGAVRIEVGVLCAYLRILPLVVGRIEVSAATLDHPDMFIALDRKPVVADSAIGRVARSRFPSPQTAMLLGRLDILHGRAHLVTRSNQKRDVDDISVDIDWPSAYASAALSGSIALNGTPIRIDAWLSQPLELLRGGQSATTLRLRSDVLTLSTSGQISSSPHIQYKGHISARAGSLRKLAEVAGYPFPKHGTFADVDMIGDLDLEPGNAALTNLNVSVDGNAYEGNLAIAQGNGIPRISATLASDFLDATPFFTGSPERGGMHALWNRAAPDLSDLRFADLDFRISASRLRLDDMEIDNAALSLMTKPGLVDLALAEATANRGIVRGRISLAAKGRTLDLQVIGSSEGVDIEPMALGHNNSHPLGGSLRASLALESTGTDFDHLIESLAGRAEISVTDGQLEKTDFSATLQKADGKPPGTVIEWAPGATAFGNLSASLRLVNGVAEIVQGQFSAPNMRLNFAGDVNLGQRTLTLAALGEMTGAGAQPSGSMPLRLRLKGSWDNPRLFQGEPDLQLPPAPQNAGGLPNPTTSAAPPN